MTKKKDNSSLDQRKKRILDLVNQKNDEKIEEAKRRIEQKKKQDRNENKQKDD